MRGGSLIALLRDAQAGGPDDAARDRLFELGYDAHRVLRATNALHARRHRRCAQLSRMIVDARIHDTGRVPAQVLTVEQVISTITRSLRSSSEPVPVADTFGSGTSTIDDRRTWVEAVVDRERSFVYVTIWVGPVASMNTRDRAIAYGRTTVNAYGEAPKEAARGQWFVAIPLAEVLADPMYTLATDRAIGIELDNAGPR